jgi:hypothetical protein
MLCCIDVWFLRGEVLDCLVKILVTKEVFIYLFLNTSWESHIEEAHHCTDVLRNKHEAVQYSATHQLSKKVHVAVLHVN